MKTIIASLAFFVGLTTSAQLTWKADKAHSRIAFSVTYLRVSEVSGHFGDFDITAKANSVFTAPVFKATIKTASVDTDNTRRDEYLRSTDYFSAKEFPTIQFRSTSFEKLRDKEFKLTGDLTIHGITRTVTLKGKLNGVVTDPSNQRLTAGLKLTGTINRLDFRVGYRTPALDNDVNMTITLQMVQQANLDDTQ